MKLRRALSVVLTLFMIVTMLPTAVFAVDAAGTVTATKKLVTDDKGVPVVDDDGYYTVELSVIGKSVTTSKQPNADVILIIDNSGSMGNRLIRRCDTPSSEFIFHYRKFYRSYYECPNCHTQYRQNWFNDLPEKCTTLYWGDSRLEVAQEVAKTFVSSILSQTGNRVAVIGFSSDPNYSNMFDDIDQGGENLNAVSPKKDAPQKELTNSVKDANDTIIEMVADGGTNYTAALAYAKKILSNRGDDVSDRPAYIVFVSDGAPGLKGQSIGNEDWDGSKQARQLKDINGEYNATIYTIGIELDDTSSGHLKTLATDENHYINVTGNDYATQLKNVLAVWAAEIKQAAAGTSAVVTDVVNIAEFDAIVPTSDKVTYDTSTGTIVWTIGAIPDTPATYTFKVKPHADLITGDYNTNKSVKLNYIAPDKTSVEKTDLGDPKIHVENIITAQFYIPDGYTWKDSGYESTKPVYVELKSDATEKEAAPAAGLIDIPAAKVFKGWKWNGSTDENILILNSEDEIDYNSLKAYATNGIVSFTAVFEDVPAETVDVIFTINDAAGAYYGDSTAQKQSVTIEGKKINDTVNFPKLTLTEGYQLKGWQVNGAETLLSAGTTNLTISATDIDSTSKTVNIKAIVEKIPEDQALVDVIFTINDKDGAYYGESTDPMTTATVTGKKVDDTVEFPVPTINDGYELKGWKLVNSNTAVTPDTYKVAADDIEVIDNKNVVKILVIVEKIPEDEALVDVIFTINDNDGAYYGESTDPMTTATVTGKKVDDTVEFPVPTINEGYELKGWKLVKSNAAVTPDTYKVAADDIEVVDKKSVVYIQAIVASKTPQIELVETQLTLKTGSATKDYDESPLTCNELTASVKYKLSDNSLVDGTAKVDKKSDFNYTVTVDNRELNVNYVLNVTITGTITNPGWTYNDLTYTPKEIAGLKVIPDYGTLTVNDVEPEPSYPIIINSWLTISNKTIAPAGFTKDSYTYEIYNTKNGKLMSTVTVKADSEKTVPIIGDATVLVVPTDAEVAGYTLTTTASPLDATVELKVPDKGEVAFTYVYTVGLNTDDHFAYIFGYEDGTVRPEGSITRAEVATIFYRLLNSEAHDAFYTTENSFSDVDPDAWYNTAVSTLAKAGIITGYPDGTYNPDGTLTRAELVTLIAKFFTEIDAADSVFTDIDGHWAAKEINEAFVNGIIDGYDDGSFKPDQSITRAESMKIINGILGRTLNEGELHPDMKEWPDNADPDAWYYYIVQEATNSHEYEIGEHETWTAILPDPVWIEPETEEE